MLTIGPATGFLIFGISAVPHKSPANFKIPFVTSVASPTGSNVAETAFPLESNPRNVFADPVLFGGTIASEIA